MKKEIVINASKDRSRIAIVEGGQLSELYIENPDNVRTIGNIYLARIRKLMPAIRAAFVDIGQKQDAFLHFSDLTENLAGLLAAAGEAVPGVAPTLATAPAKRVGDDENEPPVSDKLDLGEEDEVGVRTRGRRPVRPRGGRPAGGRPPREEEEEQEEPAEGAPRRRLPHVIDLTRRAGRIEAPPAPRTHSPTPPAAAVAAPVERPERMAPAAHAEAPIDDAPRLAPAMEAPPEEAVAKPARSRSRAKKAPAVEPGGAEPAAEDATPARAPRKSRAKKVVPAVEETGDGDGEVPEAKAPARARPSRRKVAPAAEVETVPAEVPPIDMPTEHPPTDEASPADEVDLEGDDSETEEQGADGEPARRRRRGRRGGRRRRRGGSAGGDSPRAEAEDEGPETHDAAGGNGLPEAPATPEPRGPRRAPRARPQPADEPAAAPAPPAPRARPERREPTRGGAFTGRPEELLRRDGRILVKVSKEPISAKGSRVSTDISLAGRFLVLVPAADYVAVSKKIDSAKERRRLRTLAESLKPEGFGVIVRTVAEGRDAKAIDTDLRLLVDKWRKIEGQLASRPEPPVTLYEDVSMVSSIVRDLFTDDYDRILVDDPKVHRNLKAYVQAVAPHMAERVVLHRSNVPVFRAAGIERQVEEAFSSRVSLPTGGYLVIEHTEAMHVIDVNSGRAGRGLSQSENLLRVNMEAAREVARQLRLRDLGGIIVVDFIDMYGEADRKKVYNCLKDEFRKDRAVTKLLPMSDFGIIEITRQRLRPSLTQKADKLSDEGPAGDGSEADEASMRMAAIGAGEISQPDRRYEPERRESTVTPAGLADTMEAWLKNYRALVPQKYRDRPIALLVHPLLAAFLRRGLPSRVFRWRFAMRGIPFRVEEDAGLDPLAFVVRDDKSGKTITSKYTPG